MTAVAARSLYFPNGTILIDGELIIAETFGNRLSSFELGPGGVEQEDPFGAPA